MNIKTRISKLEKTTGASSRFCLCYGSNLKYEVVPISIEEWKRRVTAGEPTSEKLPDVCPKCNKNVDKRFIERTFEQSVETVNQRVLEVEQRFITHGYYE